MKSMTGYGCAKANSEGFAITVELRSVNNKFLETAIRMPRTALFAEDAVRRCVQQHLSRGKVDVFVTLLSDGAKDVTVRLNEALLRGYYDAVRTMSDQYVLTDDRTAMSMARFPDVLTVENAELDTQAVTDAIVSVTERALADFDAMRQREGINLKKDILSRLDAVSDYVTQIEQKAPETAKAYEKRLKDKMLEALEGKPYDENRLIQEVAIFADHVAVDEETVRLRSHIDQAKALTESEGPVGRKLDFLMQEFNREANTTGSKCQNSSIAHIVVDLKSEIEKMREQVQNVE